MVVHSKVLPPELARLPCSKILHPWTTSCFQAYLDMLKSAIIGSGGFFVIMYFVSLTFDHYNKKKNSLVHKI